MSRNPAPYDKRQVSYANTFTNPWKANTLEWTTESPPPHGNWPEGLPNCYRGPYEYSVPGREEDYWPQNVPPDTAPAE